MQKTFSSEALACLTVSYRVDWRKFIDSACAVVTEQQDNDNYRRRAYKTHKSTAPAAENDIFRYSFHHHIPERDRTEISYQCTDYSNGKILDDIQASYTAVADTYRLHYTNLTKFLADRKAYCETQHHIGCEHQHDTDYH